MNEFDTFTKIDSNFFHRNYSTQMLLAVIDLKQVEPLCQSMKDNETTFSFESEKFAFDAWEGAKIIKEQKERYARVIFDLKGFSTQNLTPQTQNYIFSMCSMLLKPALMYGFAEEGLKLLGMMHDERLVGQNAEGQQFKEIAAYTFDMEMAIYGLRYQRDAQPHTKIEARSLINQICAGKFGNFEEVTSEHLKEVFLSPHKTLHDKELETTKEKG